MSDRRRAGGIAKWKSEDREVDTGAPQPPAASAGYKATPRPELVVSWEQVLAKLHSETQLVDARGAARFHAKDPVRLAVAQCVRCALVFDAARVES